MKNKQIIINPDLMPPIESQINLYKLYRDGQQDVAGLFTSIDLNDEPQLMQTLKTNDNEKTPLVTQDKNKCCTVL